MELSGKTYKERKESQLKLWDSGISLHNTEEGECCPDFSCCDPELKASDEDRNKFTKAYFKEDYQTCDEMLFAFLGGLLTSIEVEVVNLTNDLNGNN